MVACFSTAEYLSLFERKHGEAAELYYNTCFRPAKDNSPNGIELDGTKAYPPSCFNLAQMRMTGKGRTKFSRSEGYQFFDREASRLYIRRDYAQGAYVNKHLCNIIFLISNLSLYV